MCGNSSTCPRFREEQIAGLIGGGAQDLIRKALGPDVPESELQPSLQLFLSYYRAHMLDRTVLYPGVRETLDRLQDFRLAVLTNKPVHFSCSMLDGLGIYRYFAAVYGGNSFENKKPDPVGIFQILSDTQRTSRKDLDDRGFLGGCTDRPKCGSDHLRCDVRLCERRHLKRLRRILKSTGSPDLEKLVRNGNREDPVCKGNPSPEGGGGPKGRVRGQGNHSLPLYPVLRSHPLHFRSGNFQPSVHSCNSAFVESTVVSHFQDKTFQRGLNVEFWISSDF